MANEGSESQCSLSNFYPSKCNVYRGTSYVAVKVTIDEGQSFWKGLRLGLTLSGTIVCIAMTDQSTILGCHNQLSILKVC